MDKNHGRIAFGGYIETRNLYQRSTVFKNSNSDERNIHIGLDLWINESAPIHAALDGTIHSFQMEIGDLWFINTGWNHRVVTGEIPRRVAIFGYHFDNVIDQSKFYI